MSCILTIGARDGTTPHSADQFGPSYDKGKHYNILSTACMYQNVCMLLIS